MKIIGYPNPSASSYWRMRQPFSEMRKHGVEALTGKDGINKEALNWCDVIFLQSVVDKQGIALAYEYQKERGKKIVVDLDDWIETNDDNPNKKDHEESDAFFTISQTIRIADLVTVTTPYLAEKVKDYNKNVVVVPNYVDSSHFQPKQIKNNTGELRIGYFGSITHQKDLELVEKPMKEVIKKYGAKFIQVCDPRLSDKYQGYNMEFVWPVPFEWYPNRLYGLQLDFAIAPLVDNEFNRCKSWIKPLEGAVCGIPTVSSSVEPYMSLPDQFIKVEPNDWGAKLNEFCSDSQLCKKLGEKSVEFLNTVLLKDHISEWIKAFGV